MTGDMTARHFTEKPQKDYIRCVKNLAAFPGRPPETAELEDLRRFRLHLTESSLSVSSVNAAMQALRFFFSVTPGRPDLLKALFRVQGPQKLPAVLTQEEVACLLDAAPSPKHKAALSVAYGAGLRASEVVRALLSASTQTDAAPAPQASPGQDEPAETVLPPCPCCGGRMTIIEIFERGTLPRYRPSPAAVIRFDTS